MKASAISFELKQAKIITAEDETKQVYVVVAAGEGKPDETLRKAQIIITNAAGQFQNFTTPENFNPGESFAYTIDVEIDDPTKVEVLSILSFEDSSASYAGAITDSVDLVEGVIADGGSQTFACVEADWTNSTTPCNSSGSLTITWTKVGTCTGGITHPASETQSCIYVIPTCIVADWNLVGWNTCSSIGQQTQNWTKVGTCTGGYSPPLSSQYCTPANLLFGLVGYWNFNAVSGMNVPDDSGNGNIGTIIGPVGCTILGKKLNACNFSLTGDRISVVDKTQLNFGTGNFSISFWFKGPINDSDTGTAYPVLVSKAASNWVAPGWLISGRGLNPPTLSFQILGAAAGSPLINYIMPNTAHLTNWQYVVAVRNSSTLNLYVNNVRVQTLDSTSIRDTDVSSTVPLTFGSLNSGYPFKGQLDEVRVYNRTLSQSEIGQLYNLYYI